MKIMKNFHFLALFLISLLFPGKAMLQNVAERIINNSIQFHDPEGNWSKLKANMHFHSFVEREGKIDTSDRFIRLNNKRNIFEMKYEVNGRPALLIYNNRKCEGKYLDVKKSNKEELFMSGLICERAKMYNSYYRYLIGMPMKLKDPGTIIHKDVIKKEYNGQTFNVIKVTYDPEVGSYTWLFYFNQQTSELTLMEFSKDGTFENGETIELNNKINYQDMILPGQLKWLILPQRNFLAEENINYLK